MPPIGTYGVLLGCTRLSLRGLWHVFLSRRFRRTICPQGFRAERSPTPIDGPDLLQCQHLLDLEEAHEAVLGDHADHGVSPHDDEPSDP